MSEAAPKEEGKKKGKLPVLIIVAVMLFGGGFFGMKMRGGEKKEPEIKLGKIVEFEEKLYNLSDMQTYLRMTVALHLKDGYDEKKFSEVIAPVEDAMNLVVRAKSPSQVQTIAGLQNLKVELAEKINEVLASLESEKPNHKNPDEDEEAEEADEAETEKKPKAPKKPKNDWQSQTGPVLKVYFRSFAVQ